MKLSDIIPVSLTEDGWSYDGPFSTYQEHHAFYIGLGVGMARSPELMAILAGWSLRGPPKKSVSHIEDVAMEPAYALGGMFIGYFVMSRPVREVIMWLTSLI